MPWSQRAAAPSTTSPAGLNPRWRYRSRRGHVVNFRADETDREVYDVAALMIWPLENPGAGFDYLLRAAHWFTYDDRAEMRRAVEALRRRAHLAIDRTADDALRRWGA